MLCNLVSLFIMFIDTHLHLDDARYQRDRKEVIDRAREAGVEAMINVGTDLMGSQKSLELAGVYNFIFVAIGIHPHYVEAVDSNVLNELRKIGQEEKVVAIGEIGLDYYRDLSPRDQQKKTFSKLLRLAKDLGLPVMIHCREAEEEVLKILVEEKIGEVGGVMHCFSGDIDLANRVLDLGLHISFAGQITYPNAENLRGVLKKVPVKKLLLETDAPYLAPQVQRGKRNEPGFIKYSAEEIARVKEVKLEDLGRITTDNAKKLFGI